MPDLSDHKGLQASGAFSKILLHIQLLTRFYYTWIPTGLSWDKDWTIVWHNSSVTIKMNIIVVPGTRSSLYYCRRLLLEPWQQINLHLLAIAAQLLGIWPRLHKNIKLYTQKAVSLVHWDWYLAVHAYITSIHNNALLFLPYYCCLATVLLAAETICTNGNLCSLEFYVGRHLRESPCCT